MADTMLILVSLPYWLYRKMRYDHEGLLALLLAAHRYEADRQLASNAFRAGYRIGQMYPNRPLDPEE